MSQRQHWWKYRRESEMWQVLENKRNNYFENLEWGIISRHDNYYERQDIPWWTKTPHICKGVELLPQWRNPICHHLYQAIKPPHAFISLIRTLRWVSFWSNLGLPGASSTDCMKHLQFPGLHFWVYPSPAPRSCGPFETLRPILKGYVLLFSLSLKWKRILGFWKW